MPKFLPELPTGTPRPSPAPTPRGTQLLAAKRNRKGGVKAITPPPPKVFSHVSDPYVWVQLSLTVSRAGLAVGKGRQEITKMLYNAPKGLLAVVQQGCSQEGSWEGRV